MKIKKILSSILILCMLLTISVNAKIVTTPVFDAIDTHNTQVVEMFVPNDSDSDVIFATLLNNKTSERTEYYVYDTYAWQDNYTDAIFFYENENPDWNDAVLLDLTNNTFSFKLSQPMKRGEQLAVIFDDGTSVWIEYVDENNFFDNKYWVYDVYTPNSINVKIIAYIDDNNEYDVPMRYSYVLAEENIISYSPSSSNTIFTFKLQGQVGDTVIDNYNNIITIVMPAGTDISSLKPSSVTYSSKALIYPSVDAEQDFTEAVTYTVVAEDFSKTIYTVNVQVLEEEDNDCLLYPYHWLYKYYYNTYPFLLNSINYPYFLNYYNPIYYYKP